MKTINGVFEGGGVKGIGLVGAISMTEGSGYQFAQVAGTSAGSIVAALLAAGYKGHEIEGILDTLDYRRFQGRSTLNKIPLVGPYLAAIFRKGAYGADYFETWLRELLAKKGVRTFRDVTYNEAENDPRRRYKLQVIASDLTLGKMLVLPGAIEKFGVKPDDLDIAFACRMSMSIPGYFEPVIFKGHYIVDGGLRSNYPITIFDDSDIPTIGFKLVQSGEGMPRDIRNAIDFYKAVALDAAEDTDDKYIEDHNAARSILIPTCGVRTTEFSLEKDRANALKQSGAWAAYDFWQRFNFEQYLKLYSQPVSRKERLWSHTSVDSSSCSPLPTVRVV